MHLYRFQSDTSIVPRTAGYYAV